jgi:hypothetical protein
MLEFRERVQLNLVLLFLSPTQEQSLLINIWLNTEKRGLK